MASGLPGYKTEALQKKVNFFSLKNVGKKKSDICWRSAVWNNS